MNVLAHTDPALGSATSEQDGIDSFHRRCRAPWQGTRELAFRSDAVSAGVGLVRHPAHRRDLVIQLRIGNVPADPCGVQAIATRVVADAKQLAVAPILFEAYPKVAQVPFVSLDDRQEMAAGEQQHPGDVIAHVVESR
jgi:hypothetical protein